MNKLNLNVSGISNTQIETSLKNALNKIEGINSVGYDEVSKNLEVSYNEPADENQIKDCIYKAGLELS